jgi:hypothetical protein
MDYDGYPLTVGDDGQISELPHDMGVLVWICEYCSNYNVVLFTADKSIKCLGCSSNPAEDAELIAPGTPAFEPAMAIQGSYSADTDDRSAGWSPGTVPPKERYQDEAELMTRVEQAISDHDNEELSYLLMRLRQFQEIGTSRP